MPLEFASTFEKRLPELHGLDEPLPARDDLERPVAFSKYFTACVMGRGSPISSPDAFSSSTIAVRALAAESPATRP
jgi:hypothetical protein